MVEGSEVPVSDSAPWAAAKSLGISDLRKFYHSLSLRDKIQLIELLVAKIADIY